MLTAWSILVGHKISENLAQIAGLPIQSKAWLAFAVQAQHEDAGGISTGAQNNNPLNLTGNNMLWAKYGQVGYYGGGSPAEHHSNFARFSTLDNGCRACAGCYADRAYLSQPFYQRVIEAYKTNDPIKIAFEIQNSPWSSDHYGHHTLVDLVTQNIDQVGGGDDPVNPEDEIRLLFAFTDTTPNDTELAAWRKSGKAPLDYVQSVTFFEDRNHNGYFDRFAKKFQVFDSYGLGDFANRVIGATFEGQAEQPWSENENIRQGVVSVIAARISQYGAIVQQATERAVSTATASLQQQLNDCQQTGGGSTYGKLGKIVADLVDELKNLGK